MKTTKELTQNDVEYDYRMSQTTWYDHHGHRFVVLHQSCYWDGSLSADIGTSSVSPRLLVVMGTLQGFFNQCLGFWSWTCLIWFLLVITLYCKMIQSIMFLYLMKFECCYVLMHIVLSLLNMSF